MAPQARLAELSPSECLDLELWEHIFDAPNAVQSSPLRVLARDMRAQLEVRVNAVHPPTNVDT